MFRIDNLGHQILDKRRLCKLIQNFKMYNASNVVIMRSIKANTSLMGCKRLFNDEYNHTLS